MVRYDGGMTNAAFGRVRDLQCGTCGATFVSVEAVMEHLVDAYHGFQCLRCGALFAQRRQLDEHDCPGCWGPGRSDGEIISLLPLTGWPRPGERDL